MTLQKSLNKTFRYTFFSAIKSYFYIPLIGLAILTFSIPASSLNILKSLVESYKAESTPQNVLKISDFYKYCIFRGSEMGSYADLMIRVCIVILSVILAVMLFRFVTSKKTVNVYFSLAITRKNLFMANFFAGIVMLFFVIFIPFFSTAIINASIIGSSRELWLATIYYILNYFVLALISFGISAVVISVVGTVAESIVFSGTVITFTSIFFFCMEALMNIFVWGSPYNNFNYNSGASLNLKYQAFNPVLFGRSSASSLCELKRDDVNSKFEWIAPDYKMTIIWLLVAVAIFLFAMYLFQKRKVEISGFTGKSKVLNNIVIFVIGFSLFCLSLIIFSELMDGNKSVVFGALTGAVVFLIVFGVISLILTRSFKQLLSEMKILGLHYGILAVITVVFTFGLFGYSSRIPEIKDIKSVSITGMLPNTIVDVGESGFSGDGLNFYYVNVYGLDREKILLTENDFKIITDLHDYIIKDGKQVIVDNRKLPAEKQVKGVSFEIVYTLKNGKKIERFYPTMKVPTLNKLLSLEDTDYYRNFIKSALTEDANQDDSSALKNAKGFFRGESTEFSLVPYDLSTESILKLDAEMKIELLNALSKDLLALTPEQRCKPESDAIGNLAINGTYSGNYEKWGYPENSQDVTKEEIREGLIEETEAAITYSLNDTLNFYSVSWIQITEDMKNTINFLKANNMYSLLEGKGEFVSAQVISSIPSRKNALGRNNYYGSNESLLFNASKTPVQKDDVQYYSVDDFKNSVKVTDKNTIRQLISDSYTFYYNGKGYYVKLTDKDESNTILFVPAEKMPQSIASSVANLPDMDIESFYSEMPYNIYY